MVNTVCVTILQVIFNIIYRYMYIYFDCIFFLHNTDKFQVLHQTTSPVFLDVENSTSVPIFCVASSHSLKHH